MARKKKKASENLIDGAMNALSRTDLTDSVWTMFEQTGETGYYLLYKSLTDNGNMPK